MLSLCAIAAYCCALPLWEGWDEPFHYGYVESIAVSRALPVYGKARLTQEIDHSLRLAPLPHFLAGAIPGSTSFAQWRGWTPEQREAGRRALDHLPTGERYQASQASNYEAHHAPLAYIALAPFDGLFSGIPIVTRVLLLRLILGLGSLCLLYAGLLRLARAVGLDAPFRAAFLLCGLSVELVWATLGHIGNDALALPLTVWLFALWAEDASMPRLAVVLALGLLTKAYFLCFAPVLALYAAHRFRQCRASRRGLVVSLVIVALVAAPWYVRNWLLYGSVSGTTQSQGGTTFAQAIHAGVHMNWFLVGYAFLRNSLWTGNWSYTPFARLPLNLELLGGAAALAIYLGYRRAIRERELWLWANCSAFLFGVFYQAGATAVLTQGRSSIPDPWYWQGTLLCFMTFGFLGLQRHMSAHRGAAGQGIATALLLLSTGIAAVTLPLVQLPAYGAGLSRAPLLTVLRWWATRAGSDLAALVPAPVWILNLLLLTYSVLLVVCTAAALGALWRSNSGSQDLLIAQPLE